MTRSGNEAIRIQERRLLRPRMADEARVEHVRVAPDGKRLAFARRDGEHAGIYVQDPEGNARRVLECTELMPEEITWSPDGKMLAYRLSEGGELGSRRRVGWASSSAPGEVGWVGGAAHAFRPDSGAVFVFSSPTLSECEVAKDSGERVGFATDTGDPRFPPRIAVSRDAAQIALSVRNSFDEHLAVWIYQRPEGAAEGAPPGPYQTSFLTEVPGADACAIPFWSPRGVSVGLLIVHFEREKSGIVVFRGGEGDGEILYESELVDAAEAPAWAPSGDSIAFMQAVEVPTEADPDALAYRLAILSCAERVVVPVTGPEKALGQPRFLGARALVIDGGEEAHLLTFEAAP
jgi:dipeptidyl aminopeptidase/acylaminoacyl peptidase